MGKLVDFHHDLERAGAKCKNFDKKLREHVRLVKQNNNMDEDFKKFLLNRLTKVKSVDSCEKQKEKDDDHDHEHDSDCSDDDDGGGGGCGDGADNGQEQCEKRKERGIDVWEHDNYCYDDDDDDVDENDPQYEFFLKHLREHGKFYALEYEKDGIPMVLKYAEDSDSDHVCDQEPGRKLRSAMKQNNAYSSHQMPGVDNQTKNHSSEEARNFTWRKLRSAMKQNSAYSCHQMPGVDNQTKNDSSEKTRFTKNDSSEEKRNPTQRRLRSAMKENNAYSCHQMPAVDNQTKNDSSKEMRNLTRRKSRTKAQNETAHDEKYSVNKVVHDPDYLTFTQLLKTENDCYFFIHEGRRIVYDKNIRENNQEKDENHDESSSDMEIMDGSSFYRNRNVNPSMMNEDSVLNHTGRTMQSEFRHQVITLLRKPFDREEYDNLWAVVEVRKEEKRHIDLRNGRERFYSTRKIGKSYLDHYPDLGRQLKRFKDDRPRRLNILRGFFFWLQNLSRKESFRPWQDEECLAVTPGSC